jgi:hypothetical protein
MLKCGILATLIALGIAGGALAQTSAPPAPLDRRPPRYQGIGLTHRRTNKRPEAPSWGE